MIQEVRKLFGDNYFINIFIIIHIIYSGVFWILWHIQQYLYGERFNDAILEYLSEWRHSFEWFCQTFLWFTGVNVIFICCLLIIEHLVVKQTKDSRVNLYVIFCSIVSVYLLGFVFLSYLILDATGYYSFINYVLWSLNGVISLTLFVLISNLKNRDRVIQTIIPITRNNNESFSVNNEHQVFPVEQEHYEKPSYLNISINKVSHIIKTKDILYIKAMGNYIEIYCKSRKLVVKYTLKDILEELPSEFIRINRSCILNLKEVLDYEIMTKTKNRILVITVRDGFKVKTSRQMINQMLEKLNKSN